MAFRTMRRINQLLSPADAEAVLKRNTAGVLAVHGDDGYPYAVPLSYVYHDGGILLHIAKSGHKLDALLRDPKVSFTVIDADEVMPEEFTTYFRSVIVFGRAEILADDARRQEAYRTLAAKYSPAVDDETIARIIGEDGARALIVRIEIEHMSGKQAAELVRPRGEA